MFFATRPSSQAIERFIGNSEELPFSYSPIGILKTDTGRHDLDEQVVAIGRGQADFERARNALRVWKQFDIGWVELFPRQAPATAGTVVVVLIRHFGFWSLNGCRVAYVEGDRERDTRFGFAYGTLTNHAEAGEELFEVLLDPQTEEVKYRIRAVSWPRVALTRIGYPIVRLLQARFRRDSAEAMKRATHAESRRR
jgi:uncharacterized protein (UPF0548 family)